MLRILKKKCKKHEIIIINLQNKQSINSLKIIK